VTRTEAYDFALARLDEAIAELTQCKAVLLDLRDNPPGTGRSRDAMEASIREQMKKNVP